MKLSLLVPGGKLLWIGILFDTYFSAFTGSNKILIHQQLLCIHRRTYTKLTSKPAKFLLLAIYTDTIQTSLCQINSLKVFQQSNAF